MENTLKIILQSVVKQHRKFLDMAILETLRSFINLMLKQDFFTWSTGKEYVWTLWVPCVIIARILHCMYLKIT